MEPILQHPASFIFLVAFATSTLTLIVITNHMHGVRKKMEDETTDDNKQRLKADDIFRSRYETFKTWISDLNALIFSQLLMILLLTGRLLLSTFLEFWLLDFVLVLLAFVLFWRWITIFIMMSEEYLLPEAPARNFRDLIKALVRNMFRLSRTR